MKHLLILLLFLLTLAGCTRPGADAPLCDELQRAEALMYPHPDSALHILQTMDIPGDELNRATWALFTTQAKYKLYQSQSDSLINIALPYFMQHGDAQRKALALYYRAALYNEEKKVEEAQDFYLKAAEEVENTEDYQLGHLIYAGLWNVYGYRNLTDYALEAAQKALEYAKKGNDNKQIISSLAYIARINYKNKNRQVAIDYYTKAINLAKEKKEYKQLYGLTSEIAAVYNRVKDYRSALFYIQNAIQLQNQNSLGASEQLFLTIGRIYKNLNMQDSAYFYFNKALGSDNLYTLHNAHIEIYDILYKKQQYKDAILNLDKAWIYNDSITKLDKSRTLIEMQEKYDQQNVKDEAAMEIRLQKQRTQIYIGIIIVVVLLAGIYARHRYRQRIARLAEAEDRIDTLIRMLEEAQAVPTDSPAAPQDDAFVKRILLQQLGLIRLVAGTPTAQNQALLRRIAEISNDQVSVDSLILWPDLYSMIDRLYNGFYTRLITRFGTLLTEKEVQTCCLLCAGFTTKEIAVITQQTSGTVYVRKTSIRRKMGAEEGADIVGVVRNM